MWVDGPEIAQTCIAEGIPNLDFFADGTPHYTLPALIDATNPDAPVKLVDSKKIIDYLEETYPEEDPKRALYPPGTKAFQALAYYFFREAVMIHLRPLSVVGAAALQTDRTRAAYLVRHRESHEKAQKLEWSGKEKAWETAKSALDLMNSFIAENGVPQAPYFAGENITFTDLSIASNLIYLKLSLGDEEFDKHIRAHNGGRWGRILDSFAKYM